MSLEIVFWDVQHGSSTYIKTPNGKHIVCDLGVGSYENKDEVFSPLLHLRDKWGVKQLDWVIITHPHKDHIGDILNFDALSPKMLNRRKNLSKEKIMKGVQEKDKPLFEKYFEIDSQYNSAVNSQENPQDPNTMGGALLQLFRPTTGDESDLNNVSSVLVVSYASSKVIITGDNESANWAELLKNKSFTEAIKNTDILLAAHHGRDSGFSQDLFTYFKPYLTIISDSHFCDTSATDRYCKLTKGWKVHFRDGTSEERQCLTTRNDGYIVVKLGYTDDKKPFMDVKAKGK